MMDNAAIKTISQKQYDKAVVMKREWEDYYNLNWRVYLNDYSDIFRTKGANQARGYIPYMTDAVDRINGTILEAYLSKGRRFASFTKATSMRAYIMRELMGQELACNNFDELLDELTLDAQVSGYCVIHAYWDRSYGAILLRTVEPLDFYRVPDGVGGFTTIERRVMEAGDMEQYLGDKQFVREVVERAMKGDFTPNIREAPKNEKTLMPDYTPDQYALDNKATSTYLSRYAGLMRPVIIMEHWGRLYAEDGTRILEEGQNDTIYEWWTCGGEVLKPPQPSYLLGGGTPYAFGYVKRVKNAAYPPSIMQDHAALQRSHTRLINNIADKLNAHRTFWYYIKNLVDKSEISKGMNINGWIEQKVPGQPGIGSFTSALTLDAEFQMLSTVERGIQMMGVSDVGLGVPTTRGAQTLGETRDRLSMSMSFLGTVSRRIERTLLRDVVRLVIEHTLQFKLDPASNPYYESNVLAFLGPQTVAADDGLLNSTREARQEMLKTDFAEIRVTGLSDQVNQDQKAASLNYFLRMFTQIMQAMPQTQDEAGNIIPLSNAVNIMGIIAQAAELTGFDRDQILNPEFLRMLDVRAAGSPTAALPQGQPQGMGGGYPAAEEMQLGYGGG